VQGTIGKLWKQVWSSATEPLPPNEMSIRTYRFMRLTLAMMAAAIIIAVLLEYRRAGKFEDSISAYYYTAARPIFTGAMVAIGGFLLALRGRTSLEDNSLNIAGMLAPIVPLVPPRQASTETGSVISKVGFPVTDSQKTELLYNSLWTLSVVAVLAIVTLLVIGRVKGSGFKLRDWLGVGVAAGVIGLGVLLYRNVDLVHDNAHGISAGAMFVFLWPAVAINAHMAPQNPERVNFRRLYLWVAIVMIAMPGLCALIGLAVGFDHYVLWIELGELTPFLVYWVAQSIEGWNVGQVTEANVALA